MTNTTENRGYQSGNNKYKSKKKKSSPVKVIVAGLGVLAVAYFFAKPFIDTTPPQDGPIIIDEILYEFPLEQREKDGITFVGSGQEILLSFITDRLDTLSGKDFDKIAQNINFKVTNYSGEIEYDYENGTLYPCNNEIIFKWGTETLNNDTEFESLKFDFDGKPVSIGSGNIIDRVKVIPSDKFVNFDRHENSDCVTVVVITEVTEPNPENDCHFYVFTDHPNNLRNDSILLADSTNLTYFDLGEKEYVEISINGKDGPYLKQNEFVFDSTIAVLNVWARTNKNNNPVFYTGNGKNIGECKQIIEGCTNPKAPNYDPNATIDNGTCEEEDIFQTEEPKKPVEGEITEKKLPTTKTFSCSNCGTEMAITNRVLGNKNISISCQKDIITELIKQTISDGNTRRLEEYWDYGAGGTKVFFNGSDVSSSWWGIFRVDDIRISSLSIKRTGKIKKLEIFN